jgi:hypothetical protein
MRTFVFALSLGCVLASTAPGAAQTWSMERTLQLAFNADGTVNLDARNVSVRDILVEWARQCQCHVVNAEGLTGGAIMLPLQFENATQARVLESLLRQAAGYVLTPKLAGVQSASNYDTIYILPTSHPVAGAYVPPPSTSALTPAFGSPDDELPPVTPIPIQEPAAAPAPQPGMSSNPFGSRSTSPFVSITPVPGSTAPGAVTPAPGMAPQPQPGAVPSPPPAPGRAPTGAGVPIVPVAPPPGP